MNSPVQLGSSEQTLPGLVVTVKVLVAPPWICPLNWEMVIQLGMEEASFSK